MGDFPGHPFRGNQYSSIAEAAGGRSGAVGPVRVKAWRVGKMEDTGRGIFFGDSAESIAAYAHGHEGYSPEEHTLEAASAYVTQSQFSLHQELFGKSYNDAVYAADKSIARVTQGRGDSVQAHRRVEEKMARELRKRGHDALIYTDPPAPAKQEIAALKPSVIKTGSAMKSPNRDPYKANPARDVTPPRPVRVNQAAVTKVSKMTVEEWRAHRAAYWERKGKA